VLLNIKKGEDIIGRFMFVPHSQELWEAHLSPIRMEERGDVLRFAKAALKFIFEDVATIRKLIAIIPENNQHMLKMVEELGFVYEGRIRESHLRGGVMEDQEIYGIKREDV
jgi:hypothetical protein